MAYFPRIWRMAFWIALVAGIFLIWAFDAVQAGGFSIRTVDVTPEEPKMDEAVFFDTTAAFPGEEWIGFKYIWGDGEADDDPLLLNIVPVVNGTASHRARYSRSRSLRRALADVMYRTLP